MRNFNKSKSKKMPIPKQNQKIKQNFSQFNRKGNYKKAIWVGNLQPTKWSPIYNIKITYNTNTAPQVTVLSPILYLAKRQNQLPHVYPKNKLCLFDPDKKEWTFDKFIADTIIPWTSLWLSYYEDWLYTGKWRGGGRHPDKKQKSEKKRRIKI